MGRRLALAAGQRVGLDHELPPSQRDFGLRARRAVHRQRLERRPHHLRADAERSRGIGARHRGRLPADGLSRHDEPARQPRHVAPVLRGGRRSAASKAGGAVPVHHARRADRVLWRRDRHRRAQYPRQRRQPPRRSVQSRAVSLAGYGGRRVPRAGRGHAVLLSGVGRAASRQSRPARRRDDHAGGG